MLVEVGSRKLLHLQVAELGPRQRIVCLKREVTRLLPSALVVVDELPVQGHANPGPVGLDEVVVPRADLDLGRAGRRLKVVDRARNLQRVPLGVRDPIAACTRASVACATKVTAESGNGDTLLTFISQST